MIERLHERSVRPRRVRILAAHHAALLPRDAWVLDVGWGDGAGAREIMRLRPDLSVVGIDTLVRPVVAISVVRFDGRRIPFRNGSFDAAILVDVLHHADDPAVLLADTSRVCRRCIVIKDHLLQGVGAGLTLRFMDRVGNTRHSVATPYTYLSPQQWASLFERDDLVPDLWEERLGLYPFPASLVFERSLHFVARLAPASAR